MLDSIIDGAARALFVSWYADAVENGEHNAPAAGAGEDWMDVAPETPEDARAEARTFIDAVIAANPADWPAVLARSEVEADPSGFGHYLAMQGMGHGVAWSDDHPDHNLTLPAVEYHGTPEPIKCPECGHTFLLYSETVLATYRVDTAEPLEGQLANDLPEYDHNDSKDAKLTCRECWHEFPVPPAFYKGQPWG